MNGKVSRTFPDKEAHKRIIYEYILKLEITESNNMEGFQRELSRHIKQYDAIQGNEWKSLTHLPRQRSPQAHHLRVHP
jgi:hypothetical protein